MGRPASRAVLIALLLYAPTAWAQGQAPAPAQEPPPAQLPLELEWHAPAECPPAAEVRAELTRIAKVAPGHALTPLTASASVQRSGSGYSVELKTEHEQQRGERTLSAPDCTTLVRTVTLVIALAFGEGVEVQAEPRTQPESEPGPRTGPGPRPEKGPGSEREPGSEPEPESEPVPESEPEPEPEPDTESDQDSDSESPSAPGSSIPLTLLLTLGAGAQFGLLPSTAFGAAVGIEVERGPFSLGLRVHGWPSVVEEPTAGVEAQFRGLGGNLYACTLQPLAVLSLAGCMSFRADVLRAESEGALEQGGATAPYYGAGVSAGLTFPRQGTLRVRLEGAFAISLDRPRFVIDELGPVHRVPPFVGDLGLLVMIAP